MESLSPRGAGDDVEVNGAVDAVAPAARAPHARTSRAERRIVAGDSAGKLLLALLCSSAFLDFVDASIVRLLSRTFAATCIPLCRVCNGYPADTC
jgi:hypothetical protein